MRIRAKKLSTTFLLPILAAAISAMLLLSVYVLFQERHRLLSEMDRLAESMLDVSSASAREAFWNYDQVSLESIGGTLASYREVAEVMLLDDRRHAVYSREQTGEAYQNAGKLHRYNRKVYRNNLEIGEIRLVFTTYFLDQEIAKAAAASLVRDFVIILVVLVSIVILTGKTVTSIDRIASGVRAFSGGDDAVRISLKSSNEIGRLADRINHLFATIVESKASLYRLAYYDTLTGLPNRVRLFEYLRALAGPSGSPGGFALLYLDLDNFKAINDTKGHAVGDKVLKSVAAALEKGVTGDLVARIGGDEFVIVRKACPAAEVARLASDVLGILRHPWMAQDNEFNLSCSIGITISPSDGTDIDALMMNADNAMYQAKYQGRDQYRFYEQSMNESIVNKTRLQSEIRRALANDEFVLFYQPQVDLEGGRVVGVEALVRWRHPVLGLLPPSHFIGIAEETGLIVPIGESILREACRQSVMWEAMGLAGVTVAINFSARQFNKKSLVDDIRRIVQETGAKPNLLDIEITESTAMDNPDATVQTILRLKESGIQFSLDDFGSGYSSLNYLKNLPVNHLKIDKQFIQNIMRGGVEAVVVESVIKIAHSMGIAVVAEGVEVPEQHEALRAFRCDRAQGYLYSRPVDAAQIEALLRKRLV